MPIHQQAAAGSDASSRHHQACLTCDTPWTNSFVQASTAHILGSFQHQPTINLEALPLQDPWWHIPQAKIFTTVDYLYGALNTLRHLMPATKQKTREPPIYFAIRSLQPHEKTCCNWAWVCCSYLAHGALAVIFVKRFQLETDQKSLQNVVAKGLTQATSRPCHMTLVSNTLKGQPISLQIAHQGWDHWMTRWSSPLFMSMK